MENLKRLADDQLVTLYLQGNNSAFDVLLKRHQDRLFNYIYFLVRSREVAEDIFQETFVKAIMTIKQGRYTENGKFPAWITRIAHNHIIAFYAIATGECLGECAILIPKGDTESIVLEFAYDLHICWQLAKPILYFFL
mgnify:CR=1 FL=1